MSFIRTVCHLFVGLIVAATTPWAGAQASMTRNTTTSEVKINEIIEFVRVTKPSCAEVEDFSKFKLFIEGMDTGLRGLGCLDKEGVSTVSFWLRHASLDKLSPDGREAVWQVILGNAFDTIRQDGRRLDYEIRLEGDATGRYAPPHAVLQYHIFGASAAPACFAVLAVWIALLWLAARSGLLRDENNVSMALVNRTFSLAKTQLAWWFAIIFASFVFLWLVTGEIPAISGQALSFLGLSSVTTIASIGISAGRTLPSGEAGRFFRDILSDANGVTIQRFQMLVMTMALGAMFFIQVATRLTMPEFDPSLLALMGISAGTYVGLKIPEKHDPTPIDPTGAHGPVDPKLAYGVSN